jgi:SNF2 family DNA or RNA helicase
MEIVEDRALIVRTRNPEKITEVIPKSAVVKEVSLPNGKGYEVAVKWNLPNTKILRNLGFRKAPAPIERQYDWPGRYTPFDHQKETAAFLTLHRRAFCWNEQGLGKTASVIWAADYLMKLGFIRRVLVICPLSIMDSAWRADLFKTVMKRRVDIAHGSKDKRAKVINSNAEFVIINYDGVESVRSELALGGFDLIVLDEANYIKTATTKRWKMINSLIGPDTWLWMLTGTPAAQSPLDAYGLAKMMNPKSVPQFVGLFRDRVMLKISTFKYIPKPEAQQVVHEVLQPAIRFTKEECLDLPELLYSERDTPLTAQQEKYYKLLKKEMLIQVASADITAFNAAVGMNKLLQISSGAVYSDSGEVVEFDCKNKLEEMLEVVQESSHKVLIFCNFRHSIDMVQAYLEKQGITTAAIHGGVSAKRRAEIFNAFQTTPNPQVLVIQPQSAAHGVTLTAANTIIWFGPVTSAEIWLQANARVHRAGQRNPCLVVKLVSSEVERKLYKALEEKTLAQETLLDMYKEVLDIS